LERIYRELDLWVGMESLPASGGRPFYLLLVSHLNMSLAQIVILVSEAESDSAKRIQNQILDKPE